MVELKEKQIGGITVLDEENSGTIDASSATIDNVSGIVNVTRTLTPGNNSFWVDNNTPSLPKFTDSAGNTITLGSTAASELSAVLAINNVTDGYDIDLTSGSSIVSSDGYVTIEDWLVVNGNITTTGSISLSESLFSSDVTQSNEGTIWVRNNDPTVLMFTDSAGTNHVIGGEFNIVLWVDPSIGNDANDGSESSPLETPNEAFKRLGNDIDGYALIKLLPSLSATGYVIDNLWKHRTVRGTLIIEGVGVNEDFAAIALDSINDHEYIFTAAAPGWTPGEWSGYDIEVVTSANGISVGQKRSIVWNTSDTVIVAATHAKFTGSFEPLLPGDTLRIVSPSVAINTGYDSETSDFKVLYGGVGSSLDYDTDRPQNGFVRFKNIEFRHPDGEANKIFTLGAFEFFGTHITQNAAEVHEWVFRDGSVRSGPYFGSLTGEDYLYGWGLNTRARGNAIRPAIQFSDVVGEIYFCGGAIKVINGSDITLSSGGCFDGYGRSGYPYGTIYSRDSYISTSNSTNNNFYVRNFDSEYDFESENGWIYIKQPTIHIGTDSFARASHNGIIDIEKDLVNLGAGTAELTCIYGGQIRISGTDGSNFGDASVGINNTITRSAAAWEVGEKLSGTESTFIYRSN